jgi:tight adherence protein B
LIAILLFVSLFLLFLSLFVSDVLAEGVEKLHGIKDWLKYFTAPVLSSGIAFFLGTLLCRTPLAGVIWAVTGWFIPGWVGAIVTEKKKSALREDAKNFIAAASGLYASGQVTPEVVKTASTSLADPLASDFKAMIGRHNTDQRASFPRMFEGLAVKYDLAEFKALASIIGASEHAGGPKAASEGLKQLSVSLRARDRRITERQKETLQPMLAAAVTVALTMIGFVFDITVLSHYYTSGTGKIMLSGASLLILVMMFIVAKVLQPKDLTGGGS